MRPVLMNRSDISLRLLFVATMAVTFGRKTEEIAVENCMYIPSNWIAMAKTATAAVPTIAPRTNCPVLQYTLSMMALRNIQNE